MTDSRMVQEALSELLGSLGFKTMAADVLLEDDANVLAKYARIILRQTKDAAIRRELRLRFYRLRLI